MRTQTLLVACGTLFMLLVGCGNQADTTAPQVSLAVSPAVVSVAGTSTLQVTASDNVKVSLMEFFLVGSAGELKLGEDRTEPFSWDVPLTRNSNGRYLYRAKASDAAGNVGVSQVAELNVNIPAPPRQPGVLYLNLDVADNTVVTLAGVVNSGLTFTKTSTAIVSDPGRDTQFLQATFSITNTSGSTINNLVLHAVNAAGNIGGTAIYDLRFFSASGLSLFDFARGVKPSHGMAFSSIPASVDQRKTNLMWFSPAEPATINASALEYGFRTNDTTIASGGTGTITLAFRLPVRATYDNVVSLVASFLVTKDNPSRVSQSAEETSTEAASRASGANEIAFVGPDSATATAPAGVVALRLANPKIALNPVANLFNP